MQSKYHQRFLTTEERFWQKVEKTDSCWLWTAARYKEGYGMFEVATRKGVRAHRWAYESLVGPIPLGLTIDHLCRVRNCVNPSHMEAVTAAVNIKRRPMPTHCPRGHLKDAANTYKDKRGRHICLICKRAAWHIWKAKKVHASPM